MHSRLNRLPITGTVLDRLVRSLQAASWLPIIDRHMLTAACTLAFHGFLRCSEFTTGLSLTVQHTGIVLPATAHRTSAARLQDRYLSAWGNNHYRGVIGALLPSVVAGSLPRRYTQEQQPTSRHTTVQIHLRYAAHSCCLHPAYPTGAHRDRFRKLQQVHEPLLPDRRRHHCS